MASQERKEQAIRVEFARERQHTQRHIDQGIASDARAAPHQRQGVGRSPVGRSRLGSRRALTTAPRGSPRCLPEPDDVALGVTKVGVRTHAGNLGPTPNNTSTRGFDAL